jgi:hypothetical protein
MPTSDRRSISVPYSMQRTPNSTLRRTALAGWQCAEVYVRRSFVGTSE